MQVPLDVLIALWQDTADLHQFFRPATDADIAEAERQLGTQLPEAFRELYRFSNGLVLTTGDVKIGHLLQDEPLGSLLTGSRQFREWKWPVPEEALVFAVNGSGEPLALWLGPHDQGRFPEPILEIGSIESDSGAGLCAPSLAEFLLAETVLGLVLEERADTLLDRLAPYGLTTEIIPDAEAMDAFLHKTAAETDKSLPERAWEVLGELHRWANPFADSTHADPYVARLDSASIRKLLA